MKKTIIVGSLLAITLLASTAMAYQGNPGQSGPNYSPERHENMIKAMEAKNYETWKELMGNRGRVTQVINEDNFNLFAEAWQLTREGKFEEAAEIRQELGLGQGPRQMFGQSRNGFGRNMSKCPMTD